MKQGIVWCFRHSTSHDSSPKLIKLSILIGRKRVRFHIKVHIIIQPRILKNFYTSAIPKSPALASNTFFQIKLEQIPSFASRIPSIRKYLGLKIGIGYETWWSVSFWYRSIHSIPNINRSNMVQVSFGSNSRLYRHMPEQ